MLDGRINQITLLLTATVDPKGMPDSPFLASEREQQYIDTLVYYSQTYPDVGNIVFAENSGHDLTRIKNAVGNYSNIVFLSFDDNKFPRDKGKGYGELKLLCNCFDSDVFRSMKYFIKITGRLKVLNLEKVFSPFHSNVEFICDSKTFNFRFWNKTIQPLHTDARFFLMSHRFFAQNLRPNLNRIHESKGYYLENLLHDLAQAHTGKNNAVIDRFGVEPDIMGFGAHFGGKDYRSHKERLKYYVRNSVRQLLPKLKI